LLATAGGEIGRVLDIHTLAQVDLPPAAKAYLSLPDEDALEADLEWIAASHVRLILASDTDYPASLRQLGRSPAVLFVHGQPAVLQLPQLAMVGSRSPTPGGLRAARDFAVHFARAGLTVTSGLAAGIDAASHEGALLAHGSTIAVLGTGLDQIYPAQHCALAARMCERGALVSQFPPRTPPRPANFPQRNRLISGLALGTLVVEASEHSGSLITARAAWEQGRPVFAVPGSIHNRLATGCHALLRAGAQLASEPSQVLCGLKIPHTKESLAIPSQGPRRRKALDKQYEMLLDAVSFEPVTVDVLAARSGLPSAAIISMLLILELEGRVAPHPGGCYGRIP
jgi:DNA processing protein